MMWCTVVGAGLVGLGWDAVLRTQLGRLTYRTADETFRPSPGPRWWLLPVTAASVTAVVALAGRPGWGWITVAPHIDAAGMRYMRRGGRVGCCWARHRGPLSAPNWSRPHTILGGSLSASCAVATGTVAVAQHRPAGPPRAVLLTPRLLASCRLVIPDPMACSLANLAPVDPLSGSPCPLTGANLSVSASAPLDSRLPKEELQH